MLYFYTKYKVFTSTSYTLFSQDKIWCRKNNLVVWQQIAKFQKRESWWPSFKHLKLLSLPCLYILETFLLLLKSKCNPVRGSNIHRRVLLLDWETQNGISWTFVFSGILTCSTSQPVPKFYEKCPNTEGIQKMSKKKLNGKRIL